MTITLERQHGRLTRFGMFTNVWPTAINRTDRQIVGWYVHLHAWPFVLYVWGTK